MSFVFASCNKQKSYIYVLRIDFSIVFLSFSGKELQTLNFPAKKTTCCCFGGKNLDELYVTCAKFGLSDDEFRNNQPLAGSVFRVTGLGVKGYPPFDYEGDITAKL